MEADVSHLQTYSAPGLTSRIAQLRSRVGGRLKLGLFSNSMRYGLRRDLSVTIQKPKAKIPIVVRSLALADLESLLPVSDRSIDPQDKLEIAWRRGFIDKGAQSCFVAVDQRNDTPCYMQWLLSSSDNKLIQSLGGFPELRENEALLENAYTPAKYRGLGIMSAAMALIAEHAREVGATYVLTFVDQHNTASLKGCGRAGFYPHMLHHRTQVGFGLLKRDRFETLAEADVRRHAKF